MSAAVQSLTVLLPVLYLLAALVHGAGVGEERRPRLDPLRRSTVAALLFLHAFLFAARWKQVGHFPVIDAWSSLSAVALITTALYAWIASRTRQHGTGTVVLGVAFALQLLASAFGPLDPVPVTVEPDAFYALHVSTSIGAFATVGLSGIHGLLYILVFRAMRKREFGTILSHMPSLQHLALMMRRAALAGFLLLTVGVNAGIWWAHASGIPDFSYGDPWVLVMLVIWIHFGVVAFSGRIPGISARRASIAAAAGFAVLVLSTVAALLPSLSFHWSQ